MSEKTIELARRAVACPGWRWMPGMRATWPDDGRPARRYGSPGDTSGWVSDYSGKERHNGDDHALPDLDDPATLGCLLALVRETSGARSYVFPAHDGWHTWVHASPISRDFWAATEAEALVTALEAAGGAK